jgi:hypothetical protein
MKISYTLVDLILFWRREFDADSFGTIVHVLNIIDDESIPEESKLNLILEALQESGLFEIGYKEKMLEKIRKSLPPDVPGEIIWDRNGVHYQVEYFRTNLLNAIVEFVVIMN